MPDDSESWVSDLASEDVQVRYISNATVDEYLLPEEMLEMAAEECELLLRRDNLTPPQAHSLRRLLDAIRASGDFLNGYDRTNIADLVERDPTWATLRDHAGEVLREFGGDPAHLINSD